MKKTLPASVWIRWNYDGDPPYLEVSETFKDAVLPLSAYEKNAIGHYGLQSVKQVELTPKAVEKPKRKGKK
jgi:hypothetical protein